MKSSGSKLAQILSRDESAVLDEWMRQQLSSDARRTDLISEAELRSQSKEFLSLLRDAVQRAESSNIRDTSWEPVREMIAAISRSRTLQGFSPSEIAMFIFSLKPSLLDRLRDAHGSDAAGLGNDVRLLTDVIDRLGLYTTEVFQKSREEIIVRQQQEMMELSTPVVKLWEGVLALPMIGTLDSARTQVVMESLLQRIVETGAEIAILDITGVPTVDTLVAQHLLKTVTAARLMGADCIISGIRPQIAQTIVHLGVDLQDVITKASLADAFAVAMERKGLRIVRKNQSNQNRNSQAGE